MQGNESKIAFNSFHQFFGIGTFQRVTGEKNKKIHPTSQLAFWVVLRAHDTISTAPFAQSLSQIFVGTPSSSTRAQSSIKRRTPRADARGARPPGPVRAAAALVGLQGLVAVGFAGYLVLRAGAGSQGLGGVVAESGMFLLIGSRNMLVYMSLTVALFWHYAIRPIRLKRLAALGFLSFVALNIVGYLRTSNYQSLGDFWTTSASAFTTMGRRTSSGPPRPMSWQP